MMKRVFALCVLMAACHGDFNYSPGKPHHTAEGFRNNYPHPEKKGFWKWQWERWTGGVAKAPEGGYRFPVIRPDAVFLAGNRQEPTLTWIGHATFLLQLGGVNILTDPHFTQRASPVSFAGPKRHTPVPLEIAQLPRIDVVVISHNHYDHLDLDTVKALSQQKGGSPVFYVPLALKAWFRSQDIGNVVELDWWGRRDHLGLGLTLAPVQHWSQRTLWDQNRSLWGAWIIELPQRNGPALKFLFGGDFGFSRDLADIGVKFGPIDLAMLPIGSYEPRWFMRVMHVNPEEAVRAHQELHARYSVGMHWGTFRLTDETLDEPPRKLAEALSSAGVSPQRFFVMQHGETRKLDFLLAGPDDDAARPAHATGR
ncbi:MAG: MBL fold metallo-hydrolase [Burkholderiales bacterium]